jgi:protocatechuate 4,5-dioxygenase alpha chain
MASLTTKQAMPQAIASTPRRLAARCASGGDGLMDGAILSALDLDQCRLRGGRRHSVQDKETAMPAPTKPIFGTTLFDGAQARKGYALNKMCFSFNSADNRAEFSRDEEAYMRKYGLTPPQADGIRQRDVLALIAAGGNAYYLAKFAGILGLDVQGLGAVQTGMSKDDFKAMLVRANEQPATLDA